MSATTRATIEKITATTKKVAVLMSLEPDRGADLGWLNGLVGMPCDVTYVPDQMTLDLSTGEVIGDE